jgi:hypothetical protein
MFLYFVFQYAVPCILYHSVLWPTNTHNYLTNYHTATCFDTTVPSSDSLQSVPCHVTPVFQMQLSVIQFTVKMFHRGFMWAGSSAGIATAYGLDSPGIESRWGTRFSAPVQNGREAHPASCKMGTGSFPGVRCGRGVTLTPHPLLVPKSKIE